MNSEVKEIADELIITTVKAFYTDKELAIIQYILSKGYIAESEFSDVIKLHNKSIKKSITLLLGTGILDQEHITIPKEIREKRPELPYASDYYYIHYEQACNIIRYRINLIQKELERLEKQNREFQGDAYKCSYCEKKYSMNDVSVFKCDASGFYCETCNNLLIEIDTSSVKNNYEKKYNKFIKQIKNSSYHKGIFELLEKLDGQIVTSELPSKMLHLSEEPVTENKNVNRIESSATRVEHFIPSSTNSQRRPEFLQDDEEGGRDNSNVQNTPTVNNTSSSTSGGIEDDFNTDDWNDI